MRTSSYDLGQPQAIQSAPRTNAPDPHEHRADVLYELREELFLHIATYRAARRSGMSKACRRAVEAIDRVRATFAAIAAKSTQDSDVYFNGPARSARLARRAT